MLQSGGKYQFVKGTSKLKTDIKKVYEMLQDLHIFRKYLPRDYKRTSFIEGFRRLYMCPDYDHEHMKNRLERIGYRLSYRATAEESARLLEDIYNYDNRKKKVRF